MKVYIFSLLIILSPLAGLSLYALYVDLNPPALIAECWIGNEHIGPSTEGFHRCLKESGRRNAKLERFLSEP